MSSLDVEHNSKNEENDESLSSSPENIVNIRDKYQLNEKDSNIGYAKLEETELKTNFENSNDDKNAKSQLLYGNPIDILNPKYLGRAKAFYYSNNYPWIIIGPDCKYFLNKFI